MIIPIFDYKLTVVIFDKWEELERFLPKEEMEQEAKAITINQYGASLVAINSKRGSSIIHEAEHIKNSIWRYIGYTPQEDNDEVDAYLITYIYDKEQLQLIEKYKQNLEAAKQLKQQVQPVQQPVPQRMIWDEIDAEISPMTDEQKTRMLQDEDYVDTYTKIQDMVQAEILNLVKGRIEATPEGKELLQRQLKIVKKLKGKIIQETNREMEMFRKFREFSKTHPEVTYEEFIKASM